MSSHLDPGPPGVSKRVPPAATAVPAGGAPLAADQAIFTSVRSPTGSGYRLIAASTGIPAQERQELTQRCPSHASLTADGPTAEALTSWRLRTGRHCVAWSRHAGLEHTARGGYRVHSHIAILSPADYRRFEYNPARVHVAMLEALDAEPLLEPASSLERLTLHDPQTTAAAWASVLGVGSAPQVVFAVVELLLSGRDTIITGLASPTPTLDAIMAALPLCLRPDISVCAGLKFSPSREAALTFLDKPSEQARQLTRGKKTEWLDARVPPPESTNLGRDAAPADWMDLMRRWWLDGRRLHFCRLAARISEDASPAALSRLAAICNDADLVGRADTRDEVASRCAHFHAGNRLESELIERLQDLNEGL